MNDVMVSIEFLLQLGSIVPVCLRLAYEASPRGANAQHAPILFEYAKVRGIVLFVVPCSDVD